MKVLLISQIAAVNYKYTYSLANALKDAGHEVELVIDDGQENDYCRCICHHRFLTSRKDIGKLRKTINYFEAYRFIVQKAKNEHFDIVHLQWFQLSPVDCHYICKLHKAGIKIVVSIHDILPFNEKIYDKFFHRKIYHLCDEIIVQAEANIARFAELFPEEKYKVSYIPHGNFLDFTKPHDPKTSREHLGIPKDKCVFLFFGQIKTVKGVGVLLEAYGRLGEKARENMFLVIAGSVWKDDFGPYQEIIERYGFGEDELKTDIRYIPEGEVGYYYSAADIAVLPYTDVYQSGVIQLVYAYGKPAITSDIAAFKEIVVDGETGFLFKSGDTESLKEVMLRAEQNREKFINMGKTGQERIRKLFSWKDIAIKVTELYARNKDA